MRKTLAVSSFVLLSIALWVGPASADNRDLCEDYCARSERDCMCSTIRFCGPGYDRAAFFWRGGKNWSACNLSADGVECANYCATHACQCSTLRYCGAGSVRIAEFTRHQGGNWYACVNRDTASETNREQCEARCRERPQCFHCDDSIGCGMGYNHLESFGDRERWYTCGLNRHGRSCRNYCEGTSDCSECIDNRFGCRDTHVLRTFGNIGRWYACAR